MPKALSKLSPVIFDACSNLFQDISRATGKPSDLLRRHVHTHTSLQINSNTPSATNTLTLLAGATREYSFSPL